MQCLYEVGTITTHKCLLTGERGGGGGEGGPPTKGSVSRGFNLYHLSQLRFNFERTTSATRSWRINRRVDVTSCQNKRFHLIHISKLAQFM